MPDFSFLSQIPPHPEAPEHAVLIAVAFLLALFATILLVPVAMRLAIRCKVMDLPHARRVHTEPTPRWGGLAMYTAFALTVLVMSAFLPTLHNMRVYGILIGGLLMTVVGAVDDKYQVPAKWKLLGQIVTAGIAAALFGLRMVVAFNFDVHPLVSLLLSALWIVGITNTINLIDGLDGLAAGVSGIGALTFLVIAVAVKETFGFAILAAALVAVCLGFLRYNFHPAKVFMGDAGSHFLGFTIAALSLLQNWKVAAATALLIPVLILAVPIFDTAFAIIRRLARRQPIFMPDRDHLHHRLLSLGMNQRLVVLTIYTLTGLGCLAAVWLALIR
jgi:UDP-GlcNAc:undecaprenyl-phosphate GlcNAc-1-phosphate transferase